MGKCPFLALLLLFIEGCHALLGFQPWRTFSAPAESLVEAAPALKPRSVGGMAGGISPMPSLGHLTQDRAAPRFQWPSPPSVGGKLEKALKEKNSKARPTAPSPEETLSDPLPWKASVDPQRDLSYMQMFESHLKVMRELGMEQVPLAEHFAVRHSSVKPARIGSMLFKNDKFRKVRMTYFDAGENVQVFNALWYPRYEFEMPLLGIDLISLGRNRVLTVIDFQPLHPTAEYSLKYIERLNSIRDKYQDLHGTLSGKFYDDTSFFSKNMLFGRFTDESKLEPVVGPALEEYVREYVDLMNEVQPNHDPEAMDIVRERQMQYDGYSALKDPAVGLFDAYFGKDWSEDFVHNFLFTLSDKEEVEKKRLLAKAAMGPQAGGGGGNPYAPGGGNGNPHASGGSSGAAHKGTGA